MDRTSWDFSEIACTEHIRQRKLLAELRVQMSVPKSRVLNKYMGAYY